MSAARELLHISSIVLQCDKQTFLLQSQAGYADDGAPPLSKRQQKKLAKKDWIAQKKAEKKIAKKQSAKADSAKRKAQIDEALAKMTPEELEEHRKKAHAKSQVPSCL